MNVRINQMEVMSATFYLYQLATTQFKEESEAIYQKLLGGMNDSNGSQLESLRCQLQEEEMKAAEISDLIVKMGAFIQSAAIDFGNTDIAFKNSNSLN